jgi:hypothetical protein
MPIGVEAASPLNRLVLARLKPTSALSTGLATGSE